MLDADAGTCMSERAMSMGHSCVDSRHLFHASQLQGKSGATVRTKAKNSQYRNLPIVILVSRWPESHSDI